jgi:3-hydroxy-9,10-secoandrosta-1,3,5(10)-triene-9,17-dione monooxygenase
VMTGALVGDEEGKPLSPPKSIYVLVPKSDYTVDHDSWNVVGLRGTGSKDFSIKDAFVPTHRTIDAQRLLDGEAWKDKQRDEPLYRFPFSCIFPLGITSSLIGIAEGALACYLNAQRDRVAVSGVAIKDDPYVLSNIGAAAAEIAASRAAMLDNVDRFWDMTHDGKEATFEQRAIGRRTQTAAAWRAVNAVDEIFARAGGNSLQLSLPLQRFWRDAHAGLTHAIHVPGSIFHASTLTQMGGEPPSSMRIMI